MSAIAGPSTLPEDLRPFDLQGSEVARSFRACSAAQEKPRFSDTKFKSIRVFMRSGPSILDCRVLVFPDRESLEEWDKHMSRMSPTWFSPFRNKPKNGVHRGGLGGMAIEGLRMPEAAIVGRRVITVRPEHSVQYSRHHPAEDKFKLSNKKLNDLASKAMEELIKRAKQMEKSKA